MLSAVTSCPTLALLEGEWKVAVEEEAEPCPPRKATGTVDGTVTLDMKGKDGAAQAPRWTSSQNFPASNQEGNHMAACGMAVPCARRRKQAVVLPCLRPAIRTEVQARICGLETVAFCSLFFSVCRR